MPRNGVAAASVGIVLLVLVGCGSAPSGGSEQPAASPDGGSGSSSAPPASSAPPGSGAGACDGRTGVAVICLHVDSGQFAGDWTGDITLGGCDRNLIADDGAIPQPTAVDNTFRSAGTTVVGIPELNGFAFEIYDASAAADGTDQFWVALAFADYTTGLVIEPGAGAGSGEATLDDRGDTASMHAAGTFADGATGTIDVECFEVTGG